MRLHRTLKRTRHPSATREDLLFALLAGVLILLAVASFTRPKPVSASPYTPEYTADGNLIPPANYREWIFLSSGYDMAYTERTGPIPEHTVFDNVFVNPESYATFLKTGTWPDKTVMVLENRTARSKGESLVKAGRFQGDISGLEIHVKDTAHFNRPDPGGHWAFFGVKDGKSKLFPTTATCYTCHAEHAAVDTTFVQFYPTLLPIAEAQSTLSDPYKKDRATPTPAQ